jgi:hypothetical protein
VVPSDTVCSVGGCEGVTEEVVGGGAVGVVPDSVVVGMGWVVCGGLVVVVAGG